MLHMQAGYFYMPRVTTASKVGVCGGKRVGVIRTFLSESTIIKLSRPILDFIDPIKSRSPSLGSLRILLPQISFSLIYSFLLNFTSGVGGGVLKDILVSERREISKFIPPQFP